MGRRRMPGLYQRNGIWHIDKIVQGQRLCESCDTNHLAEAERYLVRRMEMLRQASVYGVRPKRTFREAATKYLLDNPDKRSIKDDAKRLKRLDSFIGHLPLESVHMGTLQKFIKDRRKDQVKNRTINHGLQLVRHILNLAADEWLDEFGLSWLLSAPKIRLLPETDQHEPYPLSFDEQDKLFAELPEHLKQMALFAVNTGCRDQEICNLRWEWEISLPIGGSVFIVSKQWVKNGQDRLVILNEVAQSVVEAARGKHLDYVFTYQGQPITRMLNTAWINARIRAGLPDVRVHDLKHTFGRRLRAASVSFEDRQDLLGHKSGRITTHYSSAELQNLIEAANKACEHRNSGTVLTLLRAKHTSTAKEPMTEQQPTPAKSPQGFLLERVS